MYVYTHTQKRGSQQVMDALDTHTHTYMYLDMPCNTVTRLPGDDGGDDAGPQDLGQVGLQGLVRLLFI